MKVTGTRELTRRLRAVQTTPRPAGRAWAEEDVRQLRQAAAVATGRMRRSFQVGSSTDQRATVTGHSTVFPVDSGARPHLIKPRRGGRLRWQQAGRTIFAKAVHHPGNKPRNFRARAAREAYRREPPSKTLVNLWNGAA